jgi:hypothetical protein
MSGVDCSDLILTSAIGIDPSFVPESGSLCVGWFHDRNADGQVDPLDVLLDSVNVGYPRQHVDSLIVNGQTSISPDDLPLTLLTVLDPFNTLCLCSPLLFSSRLDSCPPSGNGVGDFVWLDSNTNGIQDAEESGLADIGVILCSPEGDTLRHTVSTDDGHYFFANLDPGPYRIQFEQPQRYVFTRPYAGTEYRDSNADPGSGWTRTFQITDVSRLLTIDAGYHVPVKQQDWGDAPDSYQTLARSNGAVHTLGDIWLGNCVDDEPDGQPVNLDNMRGEQDEEGVEFIHWQTSGTSETHSGTDDRFCEVNIHASGAINTDHPAYLYGWIDWNQNGTWSDDEDRYIRGEKLDAPGVYSISQPVPATFSGGATWTRFRISDQPLDSWAGPADNGEVEDYLVDPVYPITLSSLRATATGPDIKIEWTTESETENIGFHVYRSDTRAMEYDRINSTLIPGQGNAQGQATYDYVDDTVESGTYYYYKVSDVSYDGVETLHGPVKAEAVSVPVEFSLEPTFPNPFNSETTIRYTLPRQAHVRLDIYNVSGQHVKTLQDGIKPAGQYDTYWDGTDAHQNGVTAGLYFVKLLVDHQTFIKKTCFVQ